MLDEKYVLDPEQDPHEPVWETDAKIADMQEVDDPNDTYPGNGNVPNLRTSDGTLDFLGGVVEEVGNFLGVHTPKIPRDKIKVIDTREMGSDKWRASTRTVTDASRMPLLVQSSKRRKVTIVNWGPSDVFIGSIAGLAIGANTAKIPVSGATVYAPRILETKDDVFAICALTTTAVVDIVEEFDCES